MSNPNRLRNSTLALTIVAVAICAFAVGWLLGAILPAALAWILFVPVVVAVAAAALELAVYVDRRRLRT